MSMKPPPLPTHTTSARQTIELGASPEENPSPGLNAYLPLVATTVAGALIIASLVLVIFLWPAQREFAWDTSGHGLGGSGTGGTGVGREHVGNGNIDSIVGNFPENSVDSQGSNAVVGSNSTSSAEDPGENSTLDASLKMDSENIPADDLKPTSPYVFGQQVVEKAGPAGKAGSDANDSDGESGTPGDGDFFGVKSKGNRFVYIIDCSGSMLGAPFTKACEELKSSIKRLKPNQRVYVIFFDSGTYSMYYPRTPERSLVPATPANIKKIAAWVDKCTGGGGTDPHDALLGALKLKPHVIYLLTDGEFDPQVVSEVTLANAKSHINISTIAFVTRAGESLLKDIAEKNNGTYKFVP